MLIAHSIMRFVDFSRPQKRFCFDATCHQYQRAGRPILVELFRLCPKANILTTPGGALVVSPEGKILAVGNWSELRADLSLAQKLKSGPSEYY